MFKRKRFNSPSGTALSSCDYLHQQRKEAQLRINRTRKAELPELLTRLNTDIHLCEVSLHDFQKVSVCLNRQQEGNIDKPVDNEERQFCAMNFFLTIQRILSRWSLNPIFLDAAGQPGESENSWAKQWTAQDILLGVDTIQMVEAAKSYIFLSSCLE